MPAPYSVALLGFSPFERNTLASYFRLATHRTPSYALVQTLSEPDFMVADADHPPSVQLALAEDMLTRTVFVGAQAPAGATAWMRRPIDPLHVMRELDAMAALLNPAAAATPPEATDPPPHADAFAEHVSGALADPHGDDLATVILPRHPPAPPATPGPTDVPPAPPVHGQRTVALPRRFRRATIEAAYDAGGARPLQVPVLAEPVTGADTAEAWARPATEPSTLPEHLREQVPEHLAEHRVEHLVEHLVEGTPDRTDEPAHAMPSQALPTVALPNPARTPPPAQALAALPPPRALLVDDSELARHFLCRLLEPWGVTCDQAPDSQQALASLAGSDYDFIFLDLELGPGSALDGLSLCQHIKRLHSNVQAALATVVMVSAHHSETDRVRGTLAGCDAYLGKPLKQDELQQLLLRQGLRPPAGTPARPLASRPA